MTDLFADIEPADLWDADPTIEPLQVAIRLHELRSELDVLVGRAVVRWRDVARRDQDYLLTVAQAIADLIVVREPDTPAVLARLVHEDSNPGTWDKLAPDEQQIAIDLLDLIIDWLEEQGPR